MLDRFRDQRVQGAWKVARALHELAQGRAKKRFGFESEFRAGRAHEDAAHLAGRDLVGQTGGQEGAGTDADVIVKLMKAQSVDAFVERLQRAEFVNRAQR